MFHFRDVSLQRKLKWITALATTVALLIACVGIVAYDFYSARRVMVRDLKMLADITARNCESPLAFGDDYKKDAAGYLAAFEAEPRITAACVFNKKGEEFARYTRKNTSFVPPALVASGQQFTSERLQVFHPVVRDGEQETIGVLYLESDLDELHSRLRTYVGVVGLVLVLALAVALALSSRLQKVISEPVLRLAETVRLVSIERNYEVRARKLANDELGVLTDGFNEMLGQIQERDDALRSAHDDLEKRVQERTAQLRQEVVERKHAETVIQQQLARISLLNQITHAISERQDVESILSVVLQQLEEHLEITRGAFYLFHEDSETFECVAVGACHRNVGQGPWVKEFFLSSLKNGDLRACASGEVVHLRNLTDASVPFMESKDSRPGPVVALPLLVEGKLFGLLVTSRDAPDGFSGGECEFLKMLSEQVALAGHQADLYSKLQLAYNELRETQQAAMQHERLRALGQLASGIAHDINNALSPVAGFAELLLLGERNLSSAGSQYLAHIRTAAEDIGHIVSRLREFYRRRDDSRELALLDVNQVAGQAVDLTRPRWKDISQQQGVNIAVTTSFDDALPSVFGIESEVREALTNLLLNAMDAVTNNGTITVSTRLRESPLGKQGGEEVLISVRDDGVGMDEETRRRCLEPFFSTKGVRGTGLGLAMVYGIMERHDGRIEVESEPGKGTTMRLVFPVRTAGEQRVTLNADPGTPLHPLRILFVDDEPLLRQLVRSMLEHDGHSVVVADGGENALSEFRRARANDKPFGAVITDLGMPQMDGRVFARRIKAESPAMPVIMLTGWGTLMRSEEGKPLPVDCVLSKPPKIYELRQALRRTVQTPAACA